MTSDFSFFVNVILPICVASIYFVMARYTKQIAPLRFLITGEKTYQYAFWIFIFFGIFLIGRPLQILSGSHPAPLIVSSIREFVMVGLLTPAIFLGCMNHLFYDAHIPKKVPVLVFGISICLAIAFVFVNVMAIGGSHEVFRYTVFGINFVAHDGNWFLNSNPGASLVPILFIIRFIDPVLMMFVASVISFWRAKTFPKKSVYVNLPKKYMLQGIAVALFGISLMSTGFFGMIFKIQSQWYYLGALLAGLIEFKGLLIPPREILIKNDVKD